VSGAAGLFALAGGVISLIGWGTGVERLTDWGSGIAIKANTAVAFATLGTALVLAAAFPSARLLIRVLGVFAALLGGLTLIEHIASLDFGIDTLLFEEPPGAPATAAPGRMGPPAAVGFLALGTAITLLTAGAKARTASVALGIGVLGLGLLSLVGYWYGAEAMYAIPRISGIAAQTAAMLAVLGSGVIAACPDRQPMRTLCEESDAGIVARRLVPLVIMLPLVVGWLRIRGQQLGYYDSVFGTAMRSVIEAALFTGVSWWGVRALRARDVQKNEALSQLRDSERRLTQTLESMKDADRRKDEFLATLAHELRNPLAPIRNASMVLLSKGLPETRLRWGAEVINRQVEHMARLLEDLLDISRISRNRLELRREWLELAAVVNSALETSRPFIDAGRHKLTIELPPAPIYVDGDPVRLAQVFSNLLNNAAKYTEPEGQLSLTASIEGHDVVVRVRDNGIGIARGMLPRIFDMFAQAPPAMRRAQSGLGIGLSLAKGVIDLHGGRIEAHSAGAGEGSEFIVRLPRVNEGAPAPLKSLPDTTVARRLLVVDDLKDSADSLAVLLTTLGHEVHTAYDGATGLEAAANLRPEAIFLDIGMPVMNGIEVCRRVREAPWGKHLRIIALTGWGQPEDRRRTQEAGFDHHLIKPADATVLAQLLSALPPSHSRTG
jgi:signal transduction histidine kinase/ActR/RegA family two-component response regulator